MLLRAGVLRCVPDHWPSEYEVKLRVMALELFHYKSAPVGTDRAELPSHLLTRTRPQPGPPQPHATPERKEEEQSVPSGVETPETPEKQPGSASRALEEEAA